MTTRMVHPLHGATHAFDAGEIERLKGLGWAVECLDPKPVWVSDADPSAIPVVFVAERKKPGPKPKAK